MQRNKSYLGSCSQGALQLISNRDSHYAEETTQGINKAIFPMTSSLSKEEDNSEGARAG